VQAACFALKKYVKEFWSPFFPTFKGPTATTPEVRSPSSPCPLHSFSDES